VTSDLQIVRRLLGVARPYWGHLAAIWLLNLMAAPIALVTPIPIRLAIDCVIGDRPMPALFTHLLPAAALADDTGRLWTIVGLMLTIAIVAGLHALVCWVLQAYTAERLNLVFRLQLFRHSQRLSLAYHDAQGSSDSVYRIQYDAVSLAGILISAVSNLVNPMITVTAMVITMATIDAQLALVALVVIPFLYLVAGAFRHRLGAKWREVKRLDSSAMGVTQEMLGALRVVKAFRLEEQKQQRFIRISDSRIREYVNVARTRGLIDLLVFLTIAAGTAAVLVIGIGHVTAGILTLGALLMVLAYLAQIYEPLKTMSGAVAELQSSFESARRAIAYLGEVPEAVERPHARSLDRAKGAIAFKGVSFSYDKTRPVLSQVSFEAPVGARVGIQGRTGAGKSTLASLLMRFYDPDEGQILLDGVDARDYKLADLRDQFAIVLQEPVLFSTTIFENIVCGRPGATRAEVEQAATMANAHQFITGLPLGYDTEVGERGMSLSGGERQRISLARAFLKDAPVLILDEPTSAVDVATETLIVDAVERLMQGRTTFVIAHRLSTLEGCDVRLLLEDGHVKVLDGKM